MSDDKESNKIEGLHPNESYANAKDFFSSELSTLSQRTNFFLVTQSILVGALAFAFQNDFPYLFPYIMSLLTIVGVVFSLLTCRSGKESSESLMRWRLYMKHLELKNPDSPWTWYYSSYQSSHKKPNTNIIDNIPLPVMWLFYPLTFAGIWLLISTYVPARILFDGSFLIIDGNNYRVQATILSVAALLFAVYSIVYFVSAYLKWRDTKHL
jgi:hypothetical protein